MRRVPRSVVAAPLVLAVAFAVSACGPAPSDSDGVAEPIPVETGTLAPESPAPDDHAFPEGALVRISATMTEVTGETLQGELTIFEPRPGSESSSQRAALEDCLVYTSNHESDEAGSDEAPWFGTATLTVTGQSRWNDDHAVRISTGGFANIGDGTASRFADGETCTNLLVGEGESTYATYFPLNYAEGGIEGAIAWSYMGFGDQGDAGGVTYSDCVVEFSPHAQAISDSADNGWSQRTGFGCYVGPVAF